MVVRQIRRPSRSGNSIAPCGSRSWRPRSGFTLIELLIVVTILTIVASVVVIDSKPAADVQLNAAAMSLADDLELVRIMAIRTGAPWIISFQPDGGGYLVQYAGSGAPPDVIHPTSRRPMHGYQVETDDLQPPTIAKLPLQLAIPQLTETRSNVSVLEFSPLGGLSPTISEDVLVTLRRRNETAAAISFRISWITGQAILEADAPAGGISGSHATGY